MHALMLNEIVKACRARQREGDCPVTAPFSREQLEDAVVELHRQLMIETGPDEECEAGVLHWEAPRAKPPSSSTKKESALSPHTEK